MAHSRKRSRRKPGKPGRHRLPTHAEWHSWEIAALHEAAHAVVAEQVGIPVDWIGLSSEPQSDTTCTVAGSTRFADIGWKESDTPAVLRALTLVALAGHALEQVLGHDDSGYFVRGTRTVWGITRDTDLAVAHAHLDELARAQGVEWTPEDRETLVAAYTARATDFIREHLAAIEAVATALLREARAVLLAPKAPRATHFRVRLEGDAIRAILGHQSEANGSPLRLAARVGAVAI
jgi:hypothetical protein